MSLHTLPILVFDWSALTGFLLGRYDRIVNFVGDTAGSVKAARGWTHAHDKGHPLLEVLYGMSRP